MDVIKVLFKELVESVLVSLRRWLVSKDQSCLAIEKNGIYVIPSFYSKNKCVSLRRKVDYYLEKGENNVWCDNERADKRLYFSEGLDKEFLEFYNEPLIRNMLRQYTGIDNPKGMLLASRLDMVEGNLGSGGGWHRDSPISRQFKAILYLDDVTDENGPFQYIKKSHSKAAVIKSVLKNILVPGQYRFDEKSIKKYESATGLRGQSVTASAGSLILVDTKGIHRGAPIKKGSRYTLFCYFWAASIPEHFEKYRQC